MIHFNRSLIADIQQGEKAGELSARCIKMLQNEKTISESTTTNRDNISNSPKINVLFESYYSQLYLSECHVTIDSLNFFDYIKIPSFSVEIKAELDSPTTINEVSETIDKMKGGKARMELQWIVVKHLKISYLLYLICWWISQVNYPLLCIVLL